MSTHSEPRQASAEKRFRSWRDLILRAPADLPFVVLAWLLLSLAAGFRVFGVEHDYHQYREFYAGLHRHLVFSEYRYEPGFVVFAWVAKNILDLDFHSFLFSIAAISLSIKIGLLRGCKQFWVLIVCYALSLYLIHEMTQIRASLGIALGYWAAWLAHRGKFRAAIACLALGVSMHYSVMVFIVLIGIPLFWDLQRPRPPISALMLIGAGAGAISAIALYFSSLNPLIDAYATQFEDQINLFSIRNLIIAAFLVTSILRYQEYSPEARAHIFFLMAGAAFFLGASSIPPIAHRFLELTVFSMFVIAGRSSGVHRVLQQSLLLVFAAFIYIRQGDYSLFLPFV